MSTVVITGASSGIGATVRRFAAPDLKPALVARDPDGLHAAAREARSAGALLAAGVGAVAR